MRWLSAVTSGNHEAFRDLVSDGVRDLNSGSNSDAAAFEARAQAVRAAFSDLQSQLDELLIEGDRIAWRWQLSGVQRGAFLGHAPSGQRITLRGVNFQRLQNGRVTEHYTLVDVQRALADLAAASATSG
jgi:steroid delta-isomerase-like uncharacterized protein